jgi:hypothetical protein
MSHKGLEPRGRMQKKAKELEIIAEKVSEGKKI